ncbi:MAG: hypothetical protein WD845_11695 [Pirellulales bacterium]
MVIHPTAASYLAEVGSAGRSTVASALVQREAGRIALRRIDVRDTSHGAFGHELAHVVLADRFTREPLPRWVDEGIAILADSADKQRRHARDFAEALSNRAEFRLVELVAMEDYPPAGRWGAFYGQSASLVSFLVQQAGEQQFLDFVAAALESGYQQGLRETYDMSIAQLERRWRTHAQRNSTGEPQFATSRRVGESAVALD